MPSNIDQTTRPEASSRSGRDVAAPDHRHLGWALAVISTAQLMVVLDVSIVNVALPSMQKSLSFHGANLEWVLNAYSLTFGGLLLLGGRMGDLYGRRRMFVFGVLFFILASLVGGFATSQAWLITCRAIQGIGGAIIAPTALSLIASTFDEGPARNRAMGVYAAMSGAGGAVGVLLGGVLTNWLNWRFVLFVNVPIGLFVALGALKVLGETESHKGRLDLPGAFAATLGMTSLVYGFIHAAQHPWGDAGTFIPFIVGAALLITFLLIETRSREPMLPLHIFSNINRAAAYAIMFSVGLAMFAMFYFLTLWMQDIFQLSPIETGLAFLPFALVIGVIATTVARIIGRVGARPILTVGTFLAAGGLFWFSFGTANGSYLGNLFGPIMVTAAGMACCFVPLTLAAVSEIKRSEAGIASAVLNTCQQVGGAVGLSVLGTIAIHAAKHKHTQLGQHVHGAVSAAAQTHMAWTAQVHGFSVALRVGSAILLFACLIAITFVRVRPPAGGASETPVAP